MTTAGDLLPAVVIGLDCITGLQTARILAARGVPVVGIAADTTHFACRTRVCQRIVQADPSGEGLVRSLERLAHELPDGTVLISCTDLGVLTISRYRDRLAGSYRFALPDHDIVDMLMDKMRFMLHAQAENLPIPRTVVLRNRSDAERAASTLSYPSVIKPPIKSALWQRNTAKKVIKVADAAELLAVYDEVAGWAELLVAQEWVEGGEDNLYSCNAYFDAAGRPLVTFVARKLRQWPPHTGTSSLGEECRNDEVLAETVRLFTGVGFHGLAYLEMKRDNRTGRHYIIEPNVGRPTGRSAVAEGGGVELVYTAYCDASGLALPDARIQRYAGVRWIDVRRDVQSAGYFLRRGDLTVRDWIASVRGRKVHAVASLADPMPFLHELAYAVRQTARAWARRRRSSLAPLPTQQGPQPGHTSLSRPDSSPDRSARS